MNPQDILKYGHTFLLGSLEVFPHEQWYTSGAVGYWSVKDVVAHLASYELVLVELLASLREPCPTPLVDEFRADDQAFNDHQVDVLRKDQSMEEVLAEYNVAYTRAMELAAQITPSQWEQEGILPWYGPEYDLEDFVVYTYYGHKREHGGQVQVFRDRFVS